MNIMTRGATAIFILALGIFFFSKSAQALGTSRIAIMIDEKAFEKGELVSIAQLPFEVHIPPKSIPRRATVLITATTDTPVWPDGMRLTTQLYTFRILDDNGEAVTPLKEFYIRYRLNVFREIRSIPVFASADGWHVSQASKFTAEKGDYFYAFETPKATFAFAEYLTQEGNASWYRYKNCDCAASTYYPRGTILRVWRITDGIEEDPLEVTVNDFGPEEKKHPDRTIDLDMTAFEKIARRGSGIIRVRTELVTRPST